MSQKKDAHEKQQKIIHAHYENSQINQKTTKKCISWFFTSLELSSTFTFCVLFVFHNNFETVSCPRSTPLCRQHTIVFGGPSFQLGLGLVVLDLLGHSVGLIDVLIQFALGISAFTNSGGFAWFGRSLRTCVLPFPPQQANNGTSSQGPALLGTKCQFDSDWLMLSE